MLLIYGTIQNVAGSSVDKTNVSYKHRRVVAIMPNLQAVKAKVAAADAKNGTGGLMAKKVDAAVKGMMAKKVNPNQVWQVVLVVDRSGSMGHEYRSGAVQDVVDRVLGFSVIVDDDGEVPAIFFDHRVEEHKIELANHSTSLTPCTRSPDTQKRFA